MRCPICGSKECCGGDMAQDNTFLLAEIDRLNAEITSLRAFVREVNEAEVVGTVNYPARGGNVGLSWFVIPANTCPKPKTELIARPRRMEV